MSETERQRLADVQEYRRLDLQNDERLERFVRMVAHVAGTEAAGISLVDDRRTWLPARVGIRHESLSLERSFCTKTIRAREAFVVTDAASDIRLRHTQLAGSPTRFYAGVPIRSRAGRPVGALFATGKAPRTITPQQLDLLEVLGRQVESDLQARQAVHPIVQSIDDVRRFEESLRDRASVDLHERCLYEVRLLPPSRVLASAEGLAAFAGVEPEAIAQEADLLALVHPEDRPVIAATLENPSSAVHPLLVRLRRRTGGYGWMELRHELLTDERGVMRGFQAQAVPREPRPEHLAGLAASRAQLVASILENQRAQGELLALLVHDFKAPLSAVLAATYALSTSERLADDEHGLLDEIEASARSLDRLVLGMLDLHQHDGGRLHPNRTRADLVEIVHEAVRTVQVYARLHGKAIEVDTPERLEADVDRELLRRALENLLDTAVRYARSRIVVEVDAILAQREILVRDDGPGIPQGQEEAVFEKFARFDGERRGRGLGLTFCRMAIEANRGTVRAEPNPPTGALFRIRLPGAPSSH